MELSIFLFAALEFVSSLPPAGLLSIVKQGPELSLAAHGTTVSGSDLGYNWSPPTLKSFEHQHTIQSLCNSVCCKRLLLQTSRNFYTFDRKNLIWERTWIRSWSWSWSQKWSRQSLRFVKTWAFKISELVQMEDGLQKAITSVSLKFINSSCTEQMNMVSSAHSFYKCSCTRAVRPFFLIWFESIHPPVKNDESHTNLWVI